MIDLHSHVLHGVDDGSRDLEQSLRMCELSRADGCTTLVATPHLRQERFWNDDKALLESRFRELEAAVEQRFGDDFEVRLGGEIAICGPSLEEIDRLPESDLFTLAGSRYLLLEPNFHSMGPDPVEMVYELGVAGWWPVIAHPERISWLVADFGLLGAMVSHGALLQLTAMSLTADFGFEIQDASRRMLDRGWVFCVSSDAHDETLRPPRLSAAREVVEGSWGPAVATALFEDGPRSVIEDRAPARAPKPASAPGEVPWWRRFLPG